MHDMSAEGDRRKQVILCGQTDVERWRDPAQLDPAWNQRAQFAAELIPAGATVLDLGCGSMALERALPLGCTYVPCDLVARDERTLVCDFNHGEFPEHEGVSHLTVLGVLEYLYDVPAFLRQLRSLARPAIVSYNPADFTSHLDRPALGWVNHLTLAELERILDEAGLSVSARLRIDSTQVLLRLSPDRPPATRPQCTILVVSALGCGNFGDRLGFHLINEVLPAHATVHHAFVNFEQDCRIDRVPSGELDLLVLGIGNSLFGPLLNDDLIRLLERARRVVGIFGTQYREILDRGLLATVLGRLHTWYARSEEDILLYGKHCRNVVHLGDWLISAFPLTQGQNPQTLQIGPEVKDILLHLDRTIQYIQSYRQVYSHRLHPLLCALTSAERVGYREQREFAGLASGKFRSLLIDVFGRTFPEDQFFEVDRAAVAAYKTKVQKQMTEMRHALQAMPGE